MRNGYYRTVGDISNAKTSSCILFNVEPHWAHGKVDGRVILVNCNSAASFWQGLLWVMHWKPWIGTGSSTHVSERAMTSPWLRTASCSTSRVSIKELDVERKQWPTPPFAVASAAHCLASREFCRYYPLCDRMRSHPWHLQDAVLPSCLLLKEQCRQVSEGKSSHCHIRLPSSCSLRLVNGNGISLKHREVNLSQRQAMFAVD